MNRSTLVFRTNTSENAGLGHLMRCRAIAEAWDKNGGKSVFVKSEARDLASDAQALIKKAASEDSSWIVLDGYIFEDAYEATLKKAGFKILALDDNGHARHENADLVLNHNPYGAAALYPHLDKSKFIGGSDYALIREEFHQARADSALRQKNKAPNILVTLGGEDRADATQVVAKALSLVEHDSFTVNLVVGPQYGNLRGLQKWLDTSPAISKRFEIHHKPESMAKLMANADFAVSACGSTTLELAYLGVPSLLIVTAANQTQLSEFYKRQALNFVLGEWSSVKPEKITVSATRLLKEAKVRKDQSEKLRKLIDGQGAQRVVDSLHQIPA